MNHSKSPWTIEHGVIGFDSNRIIDADGDILAKALYVTDAKLIAAAPELCQALKLLMHEIQWNSFREDMSETRIQDCIDLIKRLEEPNETKKPDTETMGNGESHADHQP